MSSQLPWEAMGGPTDAVHYGLNLPKPRIARFKNRSGTTVRVGDPLQIDVSNTDTTSTAWDNTANGITSNLVLAQTTCVGGRAGGMAVVVVDLLSGAGVDNADVLGCYYGPVDAYLVDTSGAIAFGEQLTLVPGSKYFDGVKASGERIFGFCIEASASTTSTGAGGTLLRVFVSNGYSGLEAPIPPAASAQIAV